MIAHELLELLEFDNDFAATIMPELDSFIVVEKIDGFAREKEVLLNITKIDREPLHHNVNKKDFA